MKSITCAATQTNLASVLDEVSTSRSPILISRKADRAVVLLSLEEYQTLEETAHLLRSPANARRLLAAVGRLDKYEPEAQDR